MTSSGAEENPDSVVGQTISSCVLTVIVLCSYWMSRHFGRHCSAADRWILMWLAWDLASHVYMHTPFMVLSLLGTTVEESNHWLAASWKEYGKADRRWLVADPNIVGMGLARTLVADPLCCVLIHAIVRRAHYRHLVQVVYCVFELCASWVLFVPELLQGSPNLSMQSGIHFWFYLVLFQSLWVLMPSLLIYQSFKADSIPASERSQSRKRQ